MYPDTIPPQKSIFEFALRARKITILGALATQFHEISGLVISKERITGFYETELDQKLKELGIENIIFAGVNTDQCVLATMADANYRGYNCILVKECCSTSSPEYAEAGALYNAQELFGSVLCLQQVINP